MPQAIVIKEVGGPEVLRLQNVDVGEPAEHELRIKQTAIGVNFHDIYVRSGMYKTLNLPGIPGIEGVGIVQSVGSAVVAMKPGDRIAYITDRYGCYAAERLIPSSWAVPLPDGVGDRTVASSFLKGLTVGMLVRTVFSVQEGNAVLVQAAAGGVGQMLCQWAKHLGAHVIGTVSSGAKAEVAKRSGCDDVILYQSENFVDRVMHITKGRGVDVAYDSVGKDTVFGSLDCLVPWGHLVNFGQSSGAVENFSVSRLAGKSLTLTRPVVFHYASMPSEFAKTSKLLLSGLVEGWLTPPSIHEFSLGDASEAHRLLESRQSSGSLILVPT